MYYNFYRSRTKYKISHQLNTISNDDEVQSAKLDLESLVFSQGFHVSFYICSSFNESFKIWQI